MRFNVDHPDYDCAWKFQSLIKSRSSMNIRIPNVFNSLAAFPSQVRSRAGSILSRIVPRQGPTEIFDPVRNNTIRSNANNSNLLIHIESENISAQPRLSAASESVTPTHFPNDADLTSPKSSSEPSLKSRVKNTTDVEHKLPPNGYKRYDTGRKGVILLNGANLAIKPESRTVIQNAQRFFALANFAKIPNPKVESADHLELRNELLQSPNQEAIEELIQDIDDVSNMPARGPRTDGPIAWLIMEKVEGESLSEKRGITEFFTMPEIQLQLAKVFVLDVMVGNGDRFDTNNVGNLMFTPDNQLSCIDNSSNLTPHDAEENASDSLQYLKDKIDKYDNLSIEKRDVSKNTKNDNSKIKNFFHFKTKKQENSSKIEFYENKIDKYLADSLRKFSHCPDIDASQFITSVRQFAQEFAERLNDNLQIGTLNTELKKIDNAPLQQAYVEMMHDIAEMLMNHT
ncbi:MAG: hypothetical protein V4629_12330 [Pseudomonadota bacterium]